MSSVPRCAFTLDQIIAMRSVDSNHLCTIEVPPDFKPCGAYLTAHPTDRASTSTSTSTAISEAEKDAFRELVREE